MICRITAPEWASRMLKKATVLTRPAPARQDAPFRGQGRSSETDPRFTFHASRFPVLWSDARTTLADFFSILLEPLFLEIVDVEPHVDRAMVRHKLGNVLLQVLLGLETHVAEPGITDGIIPLQDHIRVRDPFGNFLVGGSGRNDVFQLIGGDPGERKPLAG
jgi:hypothetical protein